MSTPKAKRPQPTVKTSVKASAKASPSSRPNPSGDPKPKRRLGFCFGLTIGVVLIGAALFLFLVPTRRKTGVGRAVDVEIAEGASSADIVARLHAAGVIENPTTFAWYLQWKGGVLPGRHLLSDDLAPEEILLRLRHSPDATRLKITLPEGIHKFEIAKRLREKRICDDVAFLAATEDPALLRELSLTKSVEGFLFPATYEFPANSDPREVVRRLVREGRARLDKLLAQHAAGMQQLRDTLTMTPVDVLTLASIIEKEAVMDEERPIIASVFLNRLRAPEGETKARLQADPSAGYGCLVSKPVPPTCAPWLLRGSPKVNAEIQHDPQNGWSTYTHSGLPPTPIANPGEKSIAAVLNPARTKYLYFVARGGGRHTFSETLSGHRDATTRMP